MIGLGPVAGRDWRWRKGRDVERDIDSPETELAIAEDQESGATGGYVTMAFDPETRIGWIHNLAVHAALRGQGLGRRLIEHALDRFRAAGMTVAKIETLEQNPIGRHLYPSLGFRGGGPADPLCHAALRRRSQRICRDAVIRQAI